MNPPEAFAGQQVVDGPTRQRHEILWTLALEGGRRAVLAQLAPELADDLALRRRYVYELERLAACPAAALPPVLASGPRPDPRDPDAAPPWRARLDPPGDDLEQVLRDRAPLPVDEAIELVARLADAAHAVHAAGIVLRDLEPARVRLDGARPWLLDVGAARFAILSSRTASSMLLEGSPYAAPEHLRATVVDPRADVFSLGVIAWRALTGELPHGDAHQVLLGGRARPPLRALCPAVPAPVAAALESALADDADARPDSARELAELLRGERALRPRELARVTCQACGGSLRTGLRLCLGCGREAVQLAHEPDRRKGFALMLKAAREDEPFHASMRELLAVYSSDPDRPLDFLVGDHRMYSKAERQRRHPLPARVFDALPRDTAMELSRRFREARLDVRVQRARPRIGRRTGKGLLGGGVAAGVGSVAAFATLSPLLGVALLGGCVAGVWIGARNLHDHKQADRPPLARLREAPAALPASDPLVARLAAVLAGGAAPDVRERVAELALCTQRLVDLRAAGGDRALVLEPVEQIVRVAAAQAEALVALDAELADLDEGALVRALAASEARGAPPESRADLLAGLDRLRALEDRRAAGLRRLLAAGELLRRAVELGGSADADEDERLYRMALAELEVE